MIENHTDTQTEKQGFFLAPPLKRKAPEDCFLSYIDQLTDGYSSSKLVRNEPRKPSDTYFVVRTMTTQVRSFRRNYSHRSMALYRTKAGGPKRSNIAYMTGSFLEMDGANDSRIKSLEDVQALIEKNNLPTASYVIQTSLGRFHLIWTYTRPLPWTTKAESYWLAQQKRLIELFKRAGFNVDSGASLNPTQNLRNPSQLKRRCKVEIHKSYNKTSLRRIYRSLNKTNIANPSRLLASTKLRRYLRGNQTFETTHAELAITLGTCTKTAQREVRRAIRSGDLQTVAKLGNNADRTRTTQYKSLLFIEQFPERTPSSSKNNALKRTDLLKDFQANGTKKGCRNRTVFVLAVGLSCDSNQTLTVREIADQLRGGSLRSGLSEKELVRTIKNAIKPIYSNPFSMAKMREWDLIQEMKH